MKIIASKRKSLPAPLSAGKIDGNNIHGEKITNKEESEATSHHQNSRRLAIP